MLERLKKSPLDRVLALLLGLAVVAVAYWNSPKVVDFRSWQPLCEGALLRPPELFQPGLYRLVAYALVRLFGLSGAIKAMGWLGPLALGGVAYQAMMFSVYMLVPRLRIDRVRPEFRTVMMPLLTAAGMGLFLMSGPVVHAGWFLTPSMLTLLMVFMTIGLFRNFFSRGTIPHAYWGMFLAGALSAESLSGIVITLCVVGVAYLIVKTDVEQQFVLSQPSVFHVTKCAFTLLYLLGFALLGGVNAWFFGSHGGVWTDAFRDMLVLPNLTAVAVLVGLVVAPLVVTVAMMPRSSDNDVYLPYVNGLLLMLVVLTSVLFCFLPETVAIDNECAKMLMLFASSFTAVAALQILLVDVYCRVQTRYPKLMRVAFFRLVLVALLALTALMLCKDGAPKLAVMIDQSADELVKETSGLKRLFSDGAMDPLLELKSACSGGRLHAHSMFGGRGEYTASLRTRDVSGDDDLSMMRIGASVTLASWIATDSPELAASAVQLGFEFWKRSDKTLPPAGGLVVLPGGGSPEELARARAWADQLADAILAGTFSSSYSFCKERRLCESFDMIRWRLGRMMELRSLECEREGDDRTARALRKSVGMLDRKNGSLMQLRKFMNLAWNQDNMQLTPRESLKVALGRANFRAAKPHAEAVLSSDPDDVAANFALGMYYYITRNFERAEKFLSTARRLRPTDPAIINNLSIVHMCQNKLESAERLALEALKIKPDSKELQSTLSEIRRRLKAD